jgi:hypothetical protein
LRVGRGVFSRLRCPAELSWTTGQGPDTLAGWWRPGPGAGAAAGGRTRLTDLAGVSLSGADEVRAQALEVAGGWAPSGAPESWRLTAALFEAIAADDELLEQLATLPPDRLPALLASAAVTFLVRRDRPVPLAGYFPGPGASQPRFDDGFFPAFRAFCAAHLTDIIEVCRSRRYQMSEVARCTQIVLGIAAAVGGSADPVALVDLGTGAGLGLQLDRYRYRVGTGTYGPAAAGLSLACDVRGPITPPPAELPRIAARVGVDLDPVDLQDPAARAWLQACTPPEVSALSRLAAAVNIARRHPEPVIAGDVIDVLPGVLGSIPRQQRIIVVDAYMAVFLPEDRRARLAGILDQAGLGRPVTWLSLDPLVPLGPSGRDSVQGLPLPPALIRDYQHGVFAVLGARTFDGAGDRGRLLARAHPSGGWIQWLSGEPAPGGESGP